MLSKLVSGLGEAVEFGIEKTTEASDDPVKAAGSTASRAVEVAADAPKTVEEIIADLVDEVARPK
jgi:hypothetical protein